MSWSLAVERTVVGLHYELVDVERSPGGLLRVTIDRIPGVSYASGDHEFVTVEDCEAVTRQLQYLLEVENVDYSRLEVSSPGLDRPLKTAAHYERFLGQEIQLTLKALFQGRKKYEGRLGTSEAPGQWQIGFNDGKEDKVLDFSLDEVREARLVPVIDFKGRRGKPAPAVPRAAGSDQTDGEQTR
jgi:ribosome maturation factor RimP